MKRADAVADLEAVTEIARQYGLPPQRMKPCVSRMLSDGVLHGGTLSPNTACLIIASELKKAEKSEEEARAICEHWQQGAKSPLGFSEIRKTVASAYRNEYDYGCGTSGELYNSPFCMGHEACPYYRRLGGKRKPSNQDFCKYGWPEMLSSAATCIYFSLLFLEEDRRVSGGTLYVTYRQLEKWAGVIKGHVKEALDELVRHGLISYKPGKVGGRYGRATEVKRIVPIPEAKTRR